MIKLYFKGGDLPPYLVVITGKVGLTPSVKFNGCVLVWLWKGQHYTKRIYGKSIISITGGVDCNLKFNKITFLN